MRKLSDVSVSLEDLSREGRHGSATQIMTTAKKRGRARQITTGRALKEEDDRTRAIRLAIEGEHYDGDVNFERLWKNIRIDSAIFWEHFLKIQTKLCPADFALFREFYQEARRKGFGVNGGLESNPPPLHELQNERKGKDTR